MASPSLIEFRKEASLLLRAGLVEAVLEINHLLGCAGRNHKVQFAHLVNAFRGAEPEDLVLDQLSGLFMGSVYALIAIGFTLVFGPPLP